MKATKLPPLSKHHKEKLVNWAKKYMENDFLKVFDVMNLMTVLEVGSFREIVNQHDLDDHKGLGGIIFLDSIIHEKYKTK